MNKKQREKQILEEDMAKFKKPPKGFYKFVEEKVVEKYIFYDRKQKYTYCTYCNSDYPTPKEIRHNKEIKCPICGKKAKGKSLGKNKYGIEDVKWAGIVEKEGNELRARYFKVVTYWGKYKLPVTSVWEDYRTIINPDGEDRYYMYWFNRDGISEWMKYRERQMFWNSYTSEWYLPRDTKFYTRLGQVIKGTPYQYSCLPGLIKNVSNYGYVIENWLYEYKKHPEIEQMYKVGFYNLIEKMALNSYNYYTVEPINKGTDIKTILGINGEQYKKLLKIGNPTYETYKMLKDDPGLDYEDLKFMTEMKELNFREANEINTLKKYMTISKARKYLNKEKPRIRDYIDYLGWLKALGYDTKDEYYLFPKEFRKAHDRLYKEVQENRERIRMEQKIRENKEIEKLKKKYKNFEPFKTEFEGMIMKLPSSSEELKKEGMMLHTCVGSYAEKVARGETMIIFIRQKAEPDEPYYTMEWKNNQIIQVRGKCNRDAPPKVQAFTKIFQAAMLNTATA